MVTLVNRYRAQHGIRPVRTSRPFSRAADRHSHDMLAGDFFAHSSHRGDAASRIRRHVNARRVSETLAFVGRSHRRPARRVVRGWIASPGHRAILLDPRLTRIGVGRRSGRLGRAPGSAYTADFASAR